MNLRYYSRNHSHAANENLLVILNVNKWPHMDAYSEPYHTPKRELKVVFGKKLHFRCLTEFCDNTSK